MTKRAPLKILTDENISPRVVVFLRESGVDVVDVKEENWHGEEDEDLLGRAWSESRYVLTHDSDFGTLAINEGKNYYGIIYLRLKNLKILNVIRVLDGLLQSDADFSPGRLMVVDESRIRIRRSNAM